MDIKKTAKALEDLEKNFDFLFDEGKKIKKYRVKQRYVTLAKKMMAFKGIIKSEYTKIIHDENQFGTIE